MADLVDQQSLADLDQSVQSLRERMDGWAAGGLRVLDTTTQVFPVNARSVTTTYTMAPRDRVILADGTGGAFTVTLPTAVGRKGQQSLTVKRTSAAGNITIASAGGTIDGATTVTLTAQYALREVISDGANWHIVSSI